MERKTKSKPRRSKSKSRSMNRSPSDTTTELKTVLTAAESFPRTQDNKVAFFLRNFFKTTPERLIDGQWLLKPIADKVETPTLYKAKNKLANFLNSEINNSNHDININVVIDDHNLRNIKPSDLHTFEEFTQDYDEQYHEEISTYTYTFTFSNAQIQMTIPEKYRALNNKLLDICELFEK